LQCSNVGKRRPESRKQGAANRLLLAAEMVLKELVSRNRPGIHAGNCAVHKYTKSQSGVQNRTNGGASVSQSPLKDKAFSTFLDQNPSFELPAENGISPSTKACTVQWPVVDSAIKRLAKGKVAVAPLSLIAVQSRNLMVAHPGSGAPLERRIRF
jgi:hypothetical protein